MEEPHASPASQQLAQVLREIYDNAKGLMEGTCSSIQSHVGWLLAIQLDPHQSTATLLTNDLMIRRAGGVPLHTLLLAVPPMESEIIQGSSGNISSPGVLLVRPVSTLSDMQRTSAETLLQHYRTNPEPGPLLTEQRAKQEGVQPKALDSYTKQLQSFGGYLCQVLGTLYSSQQEGKCLLRFSPDVEYAPSDCGYTVVKPTNRLMTKILREIRSRSESKGALRIGQVLYSATQNLQPLTSAAIADDPEGIVSEMDLDEIVARRTALFGMTRTGKSNTIKILATNLALRCPEVGQIIFDVNGEYANANTRDGGSLTQALKPTGKVDVLSSLQQAQASGKSLLPNFFVDMNLGLSLILGEMLNKPVSEAFNTFAGMNFVEHPEDELEDWHDHEVEAIKVLLFRCLLALSGYPGMSPEKIALETHRQWKSFHEKKWEAYTPLVHKIKAATGLAALGQLWNQLAHDSNPEISALGQLLAGQNQGGIRLTGRGFLRAAFEQHSAKGPRQGLGRFLCQSLDLGRLVILDLSLTKPSAQGRLMEYIASHLFEEATRRFITSLEEDGTERPGCAWMVYIEEAHNLIGVNAKADDPWPRLAKEAGKMGVGMVFATQEPSSIQSNIMSNTENLVVSHLNNRREIRGVSDFNDMETFAGSILRIRTPGFVRMRQRDIPFTLPVQVDRFSMEWVADMMNRHGCPQSPPVNLHETPLSEVTLPPWVVDRPRVSVSSSPAPSPSPPTTTGPAVTVHSRPRPHQRQV